MNRYAGSLMVALCICTAAPVLAEEVLYCTDTAKVGFFWDKSGHAAITKFTLDRFTIKIIRANPVVGQQGVLFQLFTEKHRDWWPVEVPVGDGV